MKYTLKVQASHWNPASMYHASHSHHISSNEIYMKRKNDALQAHLNKTTTQLRESETRNNALQVTLDISNSYSRTNN